MGKPNYIRQGFYMLTLVFLIVRCLYPIYGQLFNPDKLEQIVAAQNWIQGEGISRFWMSPKNPDMPISEALVQWPPGYSYLLGTLIRLDLELFQSLVIIDIAILILLSWAARSWIKIMNIQSDWIAFTLWFVFMFNTSLIEHTTTVDMLCFAMFFTSLALLYRPVEKFYLVYGIIAGILLGLTFWFRYAYLPQALSLIGFGMTYDYFYTRARLTKVWIPTLISCGVLLLVYLLRDTINNPGYIDENAGSLYFSNLTRINVHVLGEVFLGSSGLQRILVRFGEWTEFFVGISLSFGTLFIIYKAYEQKGFKSIPLIVGVSIIGINIGLLLYLSITNAPQTWTAKGWTFVEAHRYYAPTWAVLWLSVMSAVPLLMKYRVTQWVIIGIGIITLFDFGYYSKWKLKDISLSQKPGMHQLRDYEAYHSEALEIKKKAKIPVYISSDATLGLIAETAGWIPLQGEISQYPIDTQKVTLLAIQYPIDALPASWNWEEKILDSGSSVYLTHK
jgi:hypothetical protein